MLTLFLSNHIGGDNLKKINIKFRKFLSFALTLALIVSNFLGAGKINTVYAGTGTKTDPFTIEEAINYAQATFPKGNASGEVTVEGYIAGLFETTTPQGIVLADDVNQDIEAIDNKKVMYVIPNASTPQNVTEINKWNTQDKIGKKVKVTGTWRKKVVYGTEKVVTIGTVSGAYITISEAGGDTPVPQNKVSSVTASPSAGQVEAGTKVQLSCTTSGAAIYYTIDGSEPSKASTEYKEPITINDAVTISAIAVKEGMEDSDILALSYIIKQDSGLISIKDARAKTKGESAEVKGIVTYNDRNQTVYIQDSTGGIALSNYNTSIDFTSLTKGKEVTAKGTIGIFHNLVQLTPSEAVKITDESAGMPKPKLLTIPEANTGNYESQYIRIEKAKIDIEQKTLTDNDGNKLSIYYMPALTDINTGDSVNVNAVIGIYDKTIQIYGSSAEFTKADSVSDTVPPVITHTPVTAGSIYEDLKITAEITDNNKVSDAEVYYRTKGKTNFTKIKMQGTENTYAAVIPKGELSGDGLEYYIEASDGTNTVTSPSDKTHPYEAAISKEDTIGPDITIISPQSGEGTGDNLRPVICASYSDPSDINILSVKLEIDNIDVTAQASVTAGAISYTPKSDLPKGEHKAAVTVRDNSPKANISTVVWNFTVGEEVLNYYFGQLHSHTAEGSDGIGTFDEAYSWARDHAHADFFAVTDHSNWFDNELNYNLDGAKDTSKLSTRWNKMHETADKYNEDGKFAAIAGYEMTWSGSTGGWGHINTFNTSGFETRSNSKMDLKAYYADLAAHPDSISQLNHPGTTFGDFADFGYYTPQADKVVDLVEVGNGEGPVRGSGYFPSYQYYTRALDKGWHLAPTNNGDNHKGKWVDANTARDVILAPKLTRESIFDAIRKLRVYATEDQNLKISYKVNGKVMGSLLDNPEKLDISIDITDPDETDKIGKVSIIVNGGAVAAEKTFDTNKAEWDFTLDPEYSYYYVRVDEADKDIAVTSPVWTSDVTPVGISKVYSSQNVSIKGEPVDISAEIYNNGTKPISDVKVEFYKDDISEGNKIGEYTINSVEASGTAEAKINWTPDTAKDYTIYAKTVMSVDGSDKVFTESTKIVAKNREDLIKVVIDGAHSNQYVTGNYAGKVTQITKLLTQENCMIVQNSGTIDDELLNDARLLILTDPQSTDDTKYGITKSKYSAEEIAAIKKFTDNGGNLIITSKADYKDGNEEYSNGTQTNSVLEAVGSNLRVNDDEVIDDTTNGGQNYRLAFDKFNSSKYKLTEGIPDGETYSFYSGCSVVLKDKGDENNVDYLVMGHDTTETLDSDNAGDNTAVEKGNVCVLAAEKLSSGAKVIVGGSTFFSDFETTGDNENANLPITKNILAWTASAKQGSLTKIKDVRADENKDGVPDNLGKRFTIEGYVTAQSEAVTPKNAFFEVIYVQDETGGITVFGVSKTKLPLGTKVKVSGVVDEYQGDSEIQIENENYDVEITDTGLSPVKPAQMSTHDSMLEENEGWLVKVTGRVTRMDSQNIYIDDGTGEARVYVEGYIGDGSGKDETRGKWNSEIKAGDVISAIGLASEDPEGHRLRVRNTLEINKMEIKKITDVSEFKLGNVAAVSVSVKNSSPDSDKAAIIVALYDASTNKMVDLVSAEQIIESNKEVILTGRLMLPKTGNYKVKCFVWDTLDKMNPLTDVIEIPVK